MAAAPAKSPLHNFPLTFLKWGSKNTVNSHQRFRRPAESPPRPPPFLPAENSNRNSPLRPSLDGDYDCSRENNEADTKDRKAVTPILGSRSRNHRGSVVDLIHRQHHVIPEREKKCNEEYRVRVRGGGGERESNVEGETVEAEAEVEESAQKPWNLRPRRAAMKAPIEIGASIKYGELHEANQQTEKLPKSMRLRGFAEAGGSEKREKQRFWIALSKEEIEEDIYALTGSKPSRRPRKRPRNVQKQLDNFFPGLWLVGISPDAYRSLDAAPKK